MKVRDIMTREPARLTPQATLGEAATLMNVGETLKATRPMSRPSSDVSEKGSGRASHGRG